MARVDKSAAVNKAVDTIKRGEFNNYSKVGAYFKYDRTAVSKRICLLTKTQRDADSLLRQYLTNE